MSSTVSIELTEPTISVVGPAYEVIVADEEGSVISLINVTQQPQILTVSLENISILTIGTQGPQGIQGEPGPQGIAGGFVDYKERDSTYYLTFGVDQFLGVDCSNGTVNIYLPESVSGMEGQSFLIKKIDATSYVVNVNTVLGQQIDSAATLFIINYSNDEYGFMSTGSSWKVF